MSYVWTVLVQPPGLPSTGVLPGELAEPLQYPNAALSRWPFVLLLLAAVLWALYRRWQRSRSREQPRPERTPGTVPPLPAPQAPDVGEVFADLRQRYLANRQYREGCHELAQTLKTLFERLERHRVPLPWTRMTAREIRRAVGDKAAPRLLARLSDLRFGRSTPSRQDFQQVCHRAEQVVGSHQRKRVQGLLRDLQPEPPRDG